MYQRLIQVSLAIRGGYVPGKSSNANTKTTILSQILEKGLKMSVFPHYLRFLGKSENSQNRKYQTRE